jgi:hypothetical protein
MPRQLHEFSPNEIVITNAETKKILSAIFPAEATQINNLPYVSHELKSFAQGIILEGIEMSKIQSTYFNVLKDTVPITKSVFSSMSAIEKIYNVGEKIYDNYKNINDAKQPVKLTREEIRNGKIYKNILDKINNNFRTPLHDRLDVSLNKDTNHQQYAKVELSYEEKLKAHPRFSHLSHEQQERALKAAQAKDEIMQAEMPMPNISQQDLADAQAQQRQIDEQQINMGLGGRSRTKTYES